jgi:hypothetical protein
MNLVSTGLKKYKGNFWKVHYDDKNHFLKLLNMLNVFKKPYKHFVRPSWTIRLTTVRHFMWYLVNILGSSVAIPPGFFFACGHLVRRFATTTIPVKKKRKPVQKKPWGILQYTKICFFFLDEYSILCAV